MSVYFITARELGRVKIGHSAFPKQRLHNARTHSPCDLVLEAVCDGGVDEERAFHARFHGARVRGEWFDLTPEIEQVIAELTAAPVEPAASNNPVIDLLKRHSISQYDLAERLGVNQCTISRLVTGKTPVSRRTIIALAALDRELVEA